MKLSEIRGEKAIVMMADIIDPATEIMADEVLQKLINGDAPQLVIVERILREHPKSIIKILALLNEEDVETYNPSILVLPKLVKELLEDEELMGLFHSQGQPKEDESSVSASENIAE
jgi:hypothetical protein